MAIIPVQTFVGDLIIQGKAPALTIGRQVVATVLANPKDGLVLVSMFGRQMLVETTMDLQKDQILNLKVHALTPKVIMRPVEAAPEAKIAIKLMDNLVEQLVGKFGDVPIRSFEIKEILKKIVYESPDEKAAAQFVQKFVQDFSQLPGTTVAYLLVPFVGDEARGRAQVAIERDGQDYRISFDIQTDALGLVESTVVRTKSGIAVEISSVSEEVVDFLKPHMKELAQSLEPYGVTGIEIVRKRPHGVIRPEVDVLV